MVDDVVDKMMKKDFAGLQDSIEDDIAQKIVARIEDEKKKILNVSDDEDNNEE